MRALKLIACIILVASAAQAAEAPQKKLDSTLQNLAKSRETEKTLQKRLTAAEKDMQAIRERSTALAEQLQQSERKVASEEEALAKANADYAQKRAEFETRKDDYAATVLSLLRMRNLPLTAMVSSADNTERLLQTASALEKTNAAVAAKAARLREDMAQIKQLQSDVKERDATTRTEKTKLKREQNNLAIELAARQKLQSQLSADHAQAEEKVAELSRQSRSLQDLLGKLAENEKAQARIAPAPKTPNLRAFDGRRGSLKLPVNGELIHRFGDKQSGSGTYRGLVFKTRPGASVVAPYDGQIAFTGPFRNYGNMVLIKHKNGFISLIAGLGKVTSSLNQAAIRGEPIGTMPETDTAEAYVELRDSDAKPIDPAEWFANVGSNSAR